MIPDIGLIIAVYTISRLTSMISQAETNLLAKVFSVIAILVTVVATADMVSHGASIPTAFR